MLAYAKMQFSDMTNEERNAIISGLLKYCELDTLAMLMVYEHWMDLSTKVQQEANRMRKGQPGSESGTLQCPV